MGNERKDALAALESLAWHLNFFPGQNLSVAPVAKSTGLAWATTQKYATALETLGRALPHLKVSDGGISVTAPNSRWSDVVCDPLSGALMYVFLHGRMQGDPRGGLALEDHSLFEEHYEAGLKRAEAVDLIELEGGTVSLTSSGLSLAGRLFQGLQQEPEDIAWVKTSDEFSRHRVEGQRLADAAAA